MRGAPGIRLALMATALALMAIPIWLLTKPARPSEPPARAIAPPPVERDLTLEIQSAPAAESIAVSFLGQELIPGDRATGNFSGQIRLPATSPADLVVMAKWTGTEAAAVRVRVSDEDGPVAEASYWGTDHVQDVLTVPEARR